ncbi:Glutamine-rich protein 23 [Hibiscus syriacus]|uniref:Glutamine-rich protein 23 n=1 Tax=Hibiscus syriacus TaxID=106335 RepID=A0A6A3B8Z3_HIBSY|nr:histone-lysine N-methyltransferase set-2-like isoform X2 [Hibiscus syriacus]KAE8711885.1 Glutamine-rich protein 23 [Hibiscus syriacus]
MDANGNGGDSSLDFATIQILPSENRYEAYTCNDSKVEKVGVGVLEKLLPHLPGLDNLYTQGSIADYKLQPPNNLNSAHWFTKSTFTRFLHLISSTELVDTAKGIEGEISLLEETRKFQLSLYAQGHQDHIQSSKKDMSNSEDGLLASKFEVNNSSSDSSKNELLRAMDSRLTALRSELVAAFNQAAGETCSYKEITHLAKFSEIFGANDVKNFLYKFLELSQKSQVDNLSDDEKPSSAFASMSVRINKTDRNNQISKPLSSETPVKYGVSPAKAAQVERQSSTDSEESSDSSDEIQMSAERSRSLIRSASPRRSASPMRRVQIGRGGSRKAPALTIKSLIPAREKIWSQTDVASKDSEEEGSEQTKKPENNVQRMSVQDAINLFERKQRDQIPDVPIRNSLTNISLGANKAVLRRWSSGMSESSYQFQPQNTSEDPVPEPPDNVSDNDVMRKSAEVDLESDTRTEAQNIDETVDVNVERLEERSYSPIDVHVVTDIIQEEEANGRSKSSAEWSRKKEAELNQMFKRMMENQPVSCSKPQAKVRQNLSPEQTGGFYDHYKEKRDKKLRGENAGKRTEKEEKFRAMQKILNERKAEMASKKVNNLCKTDPLTKALNSAKNSQKIQKIPSQPATTRETAKETTKPSSAKKISSRTSPLPATRKSWPSTPSLDKTSGGISSAGTMPTSRKPQSAQSVPRVSPKVESSQPQQRNVNSSQANKRGSVSVNEKQQQKLMTTNKTTRKKVTAARGGDSSGVVPVKPSLYNKATKKSTVVPLESKPFLRKGSGLTSITGVVKKIKNPSKLEGPLRNTENSIDAQESDVLVNASVPVNEYHDESFSSLDRRDDANQPETQVNDHQKCDVIESVDELAPEFEEVLKNIDGSSQVVEESVISPTAWVEIEEHQNLPDQCDDQTGEIASSACIAPVESGSPRVHHSLSQMLQEESSEADTTEWGNAENPPAMVYHKDAPKGLKRLLKFARKSKGDANITGWSSPSVFSEGEDDTEDSKVYNKKNADNLLRKAALHAKNYEHNLDAHELPSAQSGISSFDMQKLQKRGVSATASTTKGTRSFFSLSAFRGSKPSDMKLRQS